MLKVKYTQAFEPIKDKSEIVFIDEMKKRPEHLENFVALNGHYIKKGTCNFEKKCTSFLY